MQRIAALVRFSSCVVHLLARAIRAVERGPSAQVRLGTM